MYGIFTYIWLIFMVNVGKYTIHGWYGYSWCLFSNLYIFKKLCASRRQFGAHCPQGNDVNIQKMFELSPPMGDLSSRNMWHCLGRNLMILSSTPLQLQGKMQPYAAVTKTNKFDKSLVEVKRCWICKK